jgi:hypothetical protein
MKRSLVIAVVSLALLSATGCVFPNITFKTGEPIREDRLVTISPGKTTKQDLLGQFGPPTAIVAQHEIAAIPTPKVWNAGPSTSVRMIARDYRFQSDTFFELFASGRGYGEYHRIYYYDYVVSSKTSYMFFVAFYESGMTETDRLWVVVNEKTGIVEDYVFKKHNQKASFGKTP